MKYEAEIIREILEQRGHEKSSLHYQTECIETWIEEAKGGYPKLCDYESEWINYIIGNHIGEFPYVTLTDVTEASVDNVIPYAYKSAILKGNTKYRDIDTGDILDTFDETKNLELVSVKVPVLTTTNEDGTKTNILTVNDPIELRGIGDVQDTLDLISGEIIESIDEGVLNGSEEWIFNSPKEQPNHWCFHNHQKLADEKLLISDRFPQSDIDGDRESIRGGGDFIFIYISKEKVEGNVNSFKQWLSQNPIKYQYRKSEKSVKTVDLSVVDENGNEINHFIPIEGTMHIQTDGTPIKPTVTLEIPVEAITQNLTSFIEMEE